MSSRNMKETPVSNCERDFILDALENELRVDGRQLDEWRELQITFGTEWGLVEVELGKTKVLCQVSCDIQQPKATQPNEGLLFTHVELSPMASQSWEPGRQSDISVLANRMLDKCLKDSRCLEMESLCIVSEEHVWAIRVDVTILNNEGNFNDAASIAGLTALAHFRHPQVTVENKRLIIHPESEKEFIPLTLYHHPICVTYSIYSDGRYLIADPNLLEEKVSDLQLMMAVNEFKELCGMQLCGKALSNMGLITTASMKASKRSKEVIMMMKEALAKDVVNRNDPNFCGLTILIKDMDQTLETAMSNLNIQLDNKGIDHDLKTTTDTKNEKNHPDGKKEESKLESSDDEDDEDGDNLKPTITKIEKGTATLENLRKNNEELVIEISDTEYDQEEDDEEYGLKIVHKNKKLTKKHKLQKNKIKKKAIIKEDTPEVMSSESTSDEITFVKEVTLIDKNKSLECIDIDDE